MTYREEGKKSSFKPKYEEKNKVITKFNFIFDQQKVNFKTEIPQLPTKTKPKPDEKGFQKKVQQIQKNIDILKQQRKKMKENIHKGSQNFDEQIKKNKNHIELGNKCLIVVKYDLQNITKNLNEVEEKIEKKTKLIRNLQRGPRQNKQQKKTHQQMTYEQLETQQQRLSTKISLSNLNKKEQAQINALIAKIIRLKMNAPHGEKLKDNTVDIQNVQDSINKLRFIKQNLSQQQAELKEKIASIEQDIQDFKDQIANLEEEKKDPQNQALHEQSQQLKNQIYKLREQKGSIQKDYQNKKAQYEYEQAKIQWIKWATEVQNKKNEEWQAGRQQRRRQKLRQKNKQKAGEGKNGEQKKEGQKAVQQQNKPQRRKINRYQKQIDNFTFLISYCNGLIGKDQQSTKKEVIKQQFKNVEEALKTGQWSKMKDVKVIKSKKENLDDQVFQKPKKKKNQKNKQTEATTTESAPTSFIHNIFIQQLFDSAKIVPPTKPQQIENIVKELNERLTYFLEHPEGGPQVEKEKQKYTAQKYAKAKYNPRQKKQKVVNTQDFPSLS